MTVSLTLKNIRRLYVKDNEEFAAVDNVNLEVKPGEFLTFLGPSGCGKTTTLRMVAGFETPTSGQILVDGADITHVPANERGLGFVFQNYALFPHMKIFDNVAYGLRIRGDSASVIKDKVREALAMVGLAKAEERYPNQLSGGEQQRVALARVLVLRPKLLLMDEPLSNLDAKLRLHMRTEIRRIQQSLGITCLYVTHDQKEALTMSDRIMVMNRGHIEQIGTPMNLYEDPATAFVADFIGESNIIDGIMVRDRVVKMYGREFPCLDGGFAENEPVDVVIRPEDIDIVPMEQGQLVGTVTSVTFKGMQYDIIVDFRGFKWLIQTTDHSPVGARIGVKIDPEGFHIMKKSEYSGMFGDYSSYSEEYEELADAGAEPEEEESEDEE